MADRSIVVRVRAQVDDLKRGMAEAKRSVDDLTKTNVKGQSEAFATLGNKAALAGTAVAVGIGLAVKSFADFDKQMSAAGAATDATGSALEGLRAAAIQAGNDTQFSATDAARAITEMGKAGVSTADILGGGLTGALSLAAAGQLDVGAAGEIAATALNQFGLAGKDLPHVADLLAAGAGKAQGSVTDLSTALNYVGPVAHSMGISIEETTGVLAEFASAGLVGEQGGTAFRGMLSSLLSPSALAQKTMRDLGISLYDANGQFIGMQATAQVLHDRLGGLDEATRNQALGQIFGNAQLAAATVLYQGGAQSVADWTSKVNDQGFATRQAAQLMDNLSGDMEKFSSAVETGFIQAGSGGNSALRSLVQGATGVVNALGQIPGPVLLVGSALGALALVGPKAFLAFRQYRSDLDNAGLSLDRISEKAPRVGRGLEIAGKAAKGFAVGMVAAAAASRAFNDDVASVGVEQLTRDLQTSSDAAGVLNRALAGATDTGTPFESNVRDLGSALRYAFDPGFLDQADQFAGSLFATVGGRNTSDIQVSTDRLRSLDTTLAQLVTGGNGSKAAEVMGAIQNAAYAQGISVDQLKTKFPQYAEALAAVTNQSGPAKDATGALAGAQKDAAQSAEDAAKANDALLQSLSAYASLVLGGRDAVREYEAAVDAASDALNKNGATLDVTTQKGRDNQAALDAIASSTLGMVTKTFEARDANTDLATAVGSATGQMQQGRQAFIDAAVSFGMSRDAAVALADKLKLTEGNVATLSSTIENVPDKTANVDANITPATTHLDQVQARMDAYGSQAPPTPPLSANPADALAKIQGAQNKMDAYERTHPEPPISVRDLATSTIVGAERALNSFDGRTATATITTRHVETYVNSNKPAPDFTAANGLILGAGGVRTMAQGGFARQAMISSRPILWAEAGPEAYIPIRPGNTRSEALLAETNRLLGNPMRVTPMSQGGVSFGGGAGMKLAGPSVAVYVQSPITGEWVRSEARIVVQEEAGMGRQSMTAGR